jgi:hypothetical protein
MRRTLIVGLTGAALMALAGGWAMIRPADWVVSNPTPGPATRELVVGGVMRPASTTTNPASPTGTSAVPASTALDAPATLHRPTVRSEISRAGETAGSCSSLTQNNLPGTTAATLDMYAFYSCLDKIVQETAKNGTYSKAFELGIYFYQVVRTNILVEAVYKDAPLNQSETAQVLRRWSRAYFDKVNDLASELHITLPDVCEAAEWEDCQKTVIPLFSKWAAAPKM